VARGDSFVLRKPCCTFSANSESTTSLITQATQYGTENRHNASGDLTPPLVPDLHGLTFWRVEGSLADLGAVRPVAFFTWNAHTYVERWARRGSMLLLALVRPALYAGHRVFATRVLHTLLAGVTRDRLDLLGEEYFEYVLKKQLKREGVARLRLLVETNGGNVVLVSQGLDHIMRPLARDFGVTRLVSNRLEFRHGVATGRLLSPVIRPRSPKAWAFERGADGRVPAERLLRDLGLAAHPDSIPIDWQSRSCPPSVPSLETGAPWSFSTGRNKSSRSRSATHSLARIFFWWELPGLSARSGWRTC
jgi:hypothetical protein